jgi:LysR family glycine cleavage system transcriptional activator
MPRKIPPFAAIRSFEAVARHGNPRAASAELYRSTSSISHQLKSLEEYLGVQLFVRSASGLELTSVAQAYLKDLSEALDLIAAATARAKATRSTSSVSVNVFPSLAVLWLMPRLASFYRCAPAVNVNIVTSIQPVPFDSGRVDCAIRYEDTASLTSTSALMFHEKMYPVCSPKYAQDSGLLEAGADFHDVTVIRCHTTPTEWDEWFGFVELPSIKPFRVLDVDNRALALEAAASGLGVAMGRTPVTRKPIDERRLIAIPGDPLPTGRSYVLHVSPRAKRNPAVEKFTQWLLREAELSRE